MSTIRASFKVWLEVDGIDDPMPISTFSSDWGMNMIPSATCGVALGRSASDNLKPSTFHKNAAALKELRKAYVWFEPTGQWDDEKEWPEGPRKIFDGYLTGVGFSKNQGQAVANVSLTHWASDLAFSSIMSEEAHPNNPSQYTYQAVYGVTKEGGGEDASGMSYFGTSDFSQITNIQDDLWGAVLKPIFCNVTSKAKEIGAPPDLPENDTENSRLIAALKRIAGGEGDCAGPVSKYAQKLSLDLKEAETYSSEVANSISDFIGRMASDAFATATIWDLLVGHYAPAFAFSVIPTVDNLLVVPFTPGLRSTFNKSVSNFEYDYMSTQAQIPRPIRSVAILGQNIQRSGAEQAASSDASELDVGGFFNPVGVTQGLRLYRNPPAWLSDIHSDNSDVERTAGLNGELAISSGTTPATEINEKTVGNVNGNKQIDLAQGLKGYYSLYAHTIYVLESIRGRSGVLSGKLRFDIAPGSTIKFKSDQEPFLGTSGLRAASGVGTVARVSIGLNAENGTASTGLQLIHVRTDEENELDQYTVTRHPLYSTVFTGAPLVDDYVFE